MKEVIIDTNIVSHILDPNHFKKSKFNAKLFREEMYKYNYLITPFTFLELHNDKSCSNNDLRDKFREIGVKEILCVKELSCFIDIEDVSMYDEKAQIIEKYIIEKFAVYFFQIIEICLMIKTKKELHHDLKNDFIKSIDRGNISYRKFGSIHLIRNFISIINSLEGKKVFEKAEEVINVIKEHKDFMDEWYLEQSYAQKWILKKCIDLIINDDFTLNRFIDIYNIFSMISLNNLFVTSDDDLKKEGLSLLANQEDERAFFLERYYFNNN